MNMEGYKDVFIEEAEENVNNLNAALLSFEKNVEDLTPVNELFRAAHTLKGMSATMGYDKLAEFTHTLEEVLDNIRSGSLAPSVEVINQLFKSIDVVHAFVANIKEQNTDSADGSRELIEEIKIQLANKGKTGKAQVVQRKAAEPVKKAAAQAPARAIEVEEIVLKAAREQNLLVYSIDVKIAKTCTFKNVRAFMVIRNLSEKGEIIKSIPPAKEIEEGNFENGIKLGFISAISAEEIRNLLMKISEIENADVTDISAKEEEEEEKEPEHRGIEPAAKAGQKKEKGAVSQSVRVNMEKIDALMNLVGELVITKIRLDQITREKKYNMLSEAVDEFDRIIDELQIEVTDVRMLPVSQIFDRYPRVIRDLAAEAGRQVECEITGGDIEIDRTVLEEINEPLMHLVRNSIAHGIEEPEQREMMGKPKKGIIRMAARRERNSVLIEVSDDGRGIQVEKVRKKAIEKGIITQEKAKTMSVDEVISLIAIPGFSTAEKTDQISGRGVGIDVVKTKVEAFGGSFKIENYEGEGCKFIMKLPLTLAIIQSLLVKCGRATYALPVIHTTETLEIRAEDVKMIQKKRVILLRGEVIPVVSLAEILKKKREEKELINMVIVEARDKRIALEIDSVIGQQEIAIKSLGEFLKYAKGFSGVTILGDGSISLIIDIQTLLETNVVEA
jgi:two-component system, chemotaxis family, sensor kinase CheA